MSYKNTDQTSFVNLFPEINDENNFKILDIWNSFRVKVLPDVYTSDAYIDYKPSTYDTLHMLAYRFYGNKNLWWIIPLINDVEDPFDFLKNAVDSSSSIKILKNDYIADILFTSARLKNAKDNG